MTQRATLNGISLAPPPSPALARSLGLDLVDKPAPDATDDPAPTLDAQKVGPSQRGAIEHMRATGGQTTIEALRDARGITRGSAEAALQSLVRNGLATRIAEAVRGTKYTGAVYALTPEGHAWTPPTVDAHLTDAQILEAVGTINARPLTKRQSAWWAVPPGVPRDIRPASAGPLHGMLCPHRRNASVNDRRQITARLEALVAQGKLVTSTVNRSGTDYPAYWLADYATKRF